mmetsp:Transcript_36290/g.95673  ORF Transcript_36290/g.95673 Transcript_36290/m.95673 type:complete len:250 (+) Transcript_36290:1190-1939(+)
MWCAHLEEQHLRHVVLEQPVKRPLVVAMPLPRDGVELDVEGAIGHDLELIAAVEDGAAVHLAVLSHELARFTFVHARVVELLELGQQEVFKMVRLHLLQAHNVGAVVDDLSQDVAPSKVPRQSPGGAVGVSVRRSVDLSEQVVRQQRKTQPASVRARRAGLADRDDNVVAHEQHPARRRWRRRRDDVARLERLGDAALRAIEAIRDASQFEHVAHVVGGRSVALHVRHLDPLLLGCLATACSTVVAKAV